MVEILRTCKWTGITEFAKAGVPEIFPSAPAQPLPSPSSSSSPSSSGPQGHTTTDLEAANAVPDDGIVWWKADDPTLNEGVDPPPVEKSPFKIAPALERNIEGRSIFECKPSFQGIFLNLQSKKCRLFVHVKTPFIRISYKWNMLWLN